MVAGTFTSNFPVPRTKPASVLPMPVANCPNAPAMQVCESVPNKTSPGRAWPFCGQRRVADAGVARTVLAFQLSLRRVEYPMAVRVVNHVIEIRQALLPHEVAQDVDIAVRLESAVKM